ncbi:MAG TPA: hypothetical protein VGO94_07055 [Mycobacteriales bacterium]|nr:hypothetical protein [Mycobacteriales bacterium]
MSTPTLVVTGSTGRLGGRVARRLAGAEVVQAAFADADADADADAVDEGVEHIVSTSLYGAAPDREVGAWVSTYTAIAAGELAGVSGDVAAIAGHEPRSLAEVLAAVECP